MIAQNVVPVEGHVLKQNIEGMIPEHRFIDQPVVQGAMARDLIRGQRATGNFYPQYSLALRKTGIWCRQYYQGTKRA